MGVGNVEETKTVQNTYNYLPASVAAFNRQVLLYIMRDLTENEELYKGSPVDDLALFRSGDIRGLLVDIQIHRTTKQYIIIQKSDILLVYSLNRGETQAMERDMSYYQGIWSGCH